MFYFTPDGWKVFAKKIKYTREVEIYDMEVTPYEGLTNLLIEDVVLTDDQLRRFETIRHVDAIGIEAIKKYVFEKTIEDPELTAMKDEIKAEDTRQKLANFIRWDALTTEEMLDLVDDFKDYEVGAFYVNGDIFNYEGQLYKVISAEGHTAQKDWAPETSHALYMPIAPPNVIAEFVKPFGGSGTYVLGAQVIFEGQVYENILAGKLNVWSPTEYPQGWRLIGGQNGL